MVTLSSEEKNKKMKRKGGENGAEDGSLRNSKQKKAVKHEHGRSRREKQLICSREKSIKVGENSSAKKKSSTLEASVKGFLLSGNSSQKQAGISKSSSFLDKVWYSQAHYTSMLSSSFFVLCLLRGDLREILCNKESKNLELQQLPGQGMVLSSSAHANAKLQFVNYV
jgi:hypothetical protein